MGKPHTTFELAVHLKERVLVSDIKPVIAAAGGLKFLSKRDAMKAARAIAKHPGVEWINVSRMTLESVGRVSA